MNVDAHMLLRELFKNKGLMEKETKYFSQFWI